MVTDTYSPWKLTRLMQTSTARCAPKRAPETTTAASTSSAIPTPSLMTFRPSPGRRKATAKKTGTKTVTHEGRHDVGWRAAVGGRRCAAERIARPVPASNIRTAAWPCCGLTPS